MRLKFKRIFSSSPNSCLPSLVCRSFDDGNLLNEILIPHAIHADPVDENLCVCVWMAALNLFMCTHFFFSVDAGCVRGKGKSS